MPVDKFGRQKREFTNTAKVSLIRMNDTFLRRDGQNTAIGTINMTGNTLTNVSKPVHDYDCANKIYVDENVGVSKTGDTMSGNLNMDNNRLTGLPTTLPQTSSDAVSWSRAVQLVRDSEKHCVKKTGDIMTGSLIVSADGNKDRTLGCTNLNFGRSFTIPLGTSTNRLYFRYYREPVILYTDNGFLIKVDTENICQLGNTNDPPEIIIHKNVRMNSNCLTNLPMPTLPHEAANKLYVDDIGSTPRKIFQGYIPHLRSSPGANNDKFGFIVTASSYLSNNFRPEYAFNGLYKPRGNAGRWMTKGETSNFWIQIKCPDFVRPWKIALRGKDEDEQRIFRWKLGGSINGEIFTDLYEAPNPTFIGSEVQYFEFKTAEKFNIFRLFCLEGEPKNPALSYMQLYIYSD